MTGVIAVAESNATEAAGTTPVNLAGQRGSLLRGRHASDAREKMKLKPLPWGSGDSFLVDYFGFFFAKCRIRSSPRNIFREPILTASSPSI